MVRRLNTATPMTQEASNKAINAKCDQIKRTGDKLVTLVQEGMEMCVQHASEYGDCTGAARLVNSMRLEMRRAQVINHFADYSPIRIVKDAKTNLMKASLRKEEDKGYKPFDLPGLKANPWYERSDANMEPGVPFDLGVADERVLKLADYIENKAKVDDKSKVSQDDRDHLKALASELRQVAKKFARDNTHVLEGSQLVKAEEQIETPNRKVA